MTQIFNPFEALELRLSNIETILEDIKKNTNDNSNLPDNSEDIGAITLAEKITGLAKPTLYALVSQGKIPFMKKGKKLYFSRGELLTWIRSGKNKTSIDSSSETASKILLRKKIGK
jgi:excisionase family DNA binding protein